MDQLEDAIVMERCLDALEAGILPSDNDMLHFNHKGVKWMDAVGWKKLDENYVINRKCYYPIRLIKDCIIIPIEDILLVP